MKGKVKGKVREQGIEFATVRCDNKLAKYELRDFYNKWRN